MKSSNPYQVYQQTQINTVSQGKLILMLYDGAIGFLHQAQEMISQKDYEKTNYYLIRTQDIIDELTNTLNLEAGGEVARYLYSVYEAINHWLVQANIKCDHNLVERVINMLQELQEAWRNVICGTMQNIEEGI